MESMGSDNQMMGVREAAMRMSKQHTLASRRSLKRTPIGD